MDYKWNYTTWPVVEIPGFAPFSVLEYAPLLKVACLCVFIWICVRLTLVLTEPAWYERLNNNVAKRTFVIGATIGLGFKFFILPSCMLAAYMTPPEDDIAGILAPMNVYQQCCWGSRGMVTILELIHFTLNRELVLHHALILFAMFLIGRFSVPHRGFDLALGTLVSEIPNSFFMIFKELGILTNYPTLDWVLPLSSAVLGFVFRVPGVVMAIAMLPTTGLRDEPIVVTLVAYLFHLAYVLNLTWRRLKRAGVWRQVGERGFHLRLSRRLIISPTSLYTGLAALSAQITVLALCSFVVPSTRSKLIEISWLSLPGTLAVVSLFLVLLPQLFNNGSHKDLPPAIPSKPMFQVAMPNCSTISRWVIIGWVTYTVVICTLGYTPDANRKSRAPADVLARQPPFCGLVLSWQFWVSATSAWVLSTFAAHFLLDVGSTTEEESCIVVAETKK